MRRVILITNSHFRCGNATYGRLLQKQLERWYEVSVRSSTDGINQDEVPGTTFVINWHPFRVPVSPQGFHFTKSLGAKFLIIHQNTGDGPLSRQEAEVLGAADAVVAHEKVAALPSAHVVPHGIIEVEDTHPEESWTRRSARLRDHLPVIGTAGFPFPWKGFDAVVGIANELGINARIIAPGYEGQNFEADYDRWGHVLGSRLILETDFKPEEEVIRLLSKNWVNVFPFESLTPDDGFGQSGSARLGVAAMQPVVFSQHRKLRTLAEVSDASYVAQGYEQTRDTVHTLLEKIGLGYQVASPWKILEQQGWSRVGQMYRDVIEGLWT